MSTVSADLVDILYRSRVTLLDHLEYFHKYNTAKYRKFSHKEIGEMLAAGTHQDNNSVYPAFQMELQKHEGEEEQPSKCLVIYALANRMKQKLVTLISNIIEPEGGDPLDVDTTEVIVIVNEPIMPNFHSTAAQAWITKRARFRFFYAASLVNNPLNHFLVPKHEKVPKEEEEGLLKSLYAEKKQLPLIRFHEDPIAKMIGLLPGDIVKITRPSPMTGECVMYRVCVP